jgi:hypothetical protein
VSLGRDGKLIVRDFSGIHTVDPRNGAVTTLIPANAMPDPGVGLIGYDPWTDSIMTYGFVGVFANIYTHWLGDPPANNWNLLFYGILPNDWPYSCLSGAERPFEVFGSGCANTTGRDPRLGWQGMPRQNEAFALDVRDAEPNGFALIWLGLSDSYWATFGALPFEATPLGAPGCQLLASADVSYPLSVDGSGRATITLAVPINSSLAGMKVFAQSASSSGANSLGFAASDAVTIRIR